MQFVSGLASFGCCFAGPPPLVFWVVNCRAGGPEEKYEIKGDELWVRGFKVLGLGPRVYNFGFGFIVHGVPLNV